MTMSEALIAEKTELMEKYAQDLANKVNAEMEGAVIYDIKLTTRPPYNHDGKVYFTGFISAYIKFDRIEPVFLTQEDKELWQSKIKNVLADVCECEYIDYMSIDFSEDTCENLYELTEKKKNQLEAGFEKIKRFIKWYCSSVKLYDSIVVENHKLMMGNFLKSMETVPR